MRALEKTLEETSGASLIAHAPTEQIKQGFEYKGKREREKKHISLTKKSEIKLLQHIISLEEIT